MLLCYKAHSREEARKQIETGQRVLEEDLCIRQVFEQHAETLQESDIHAHIPKDRILMALRKFDIEIDENASNEFLKKHDLDDEGTVDFEKFKHTILLLLSPPQQQDIQRVFNQHSQNSASGDFNFIPAASVNEVLAKLSLNSKTAEKVQLFFNRGVYIEDNKITFEEFNHAILSISALPDEQEISRVYNEHAVPGTYRCIPFDKLGLALEALGVDITNDQHAHHTRTVELNFNGRITYNALKYIARLPSPAEVWAKALPLSKLLADALPKVSGCDHLRVISSLSTQEVNYVAEEVCSALKVLLKKHVDELNISFQSMDTQVLSDDAQTDSKFVVTKMTAGSIKNFHEGLEGRIGISPMSGSSLVCFCF